jgi:uracil-DNA glycosylase family 4
MPTSRLLTDADGFGVGNPDAELMFIGEAPGADEDKQGEPFVGRAGQLLTRIIETMGFTREEVYIANILKCRPDTSPGSFGNRPPTPREMQTCRPYLIEQIEVIEPKVLVALELLLSKVARHARDDAGIARQMALRQWNAVNDHHHPAYFLRNQAPSEKRKVWEDMLQVLEPTRRSQLPKGSAIIFCSRFAVRSASQAALFHITRRVVPGRRLRNRRKIASSFRDPNAIAIDAIIRRTSRRETLILRCNALAPDSRRSASVPQSMPAKLSPREHAYSRSHTSIASRIPGRAQPSPPNFDRSARSAPVPREFAPDSGLRKSIRRSENNICQLGDHFRHPVEY